MIEIETLKNSVEILFGSDNLMISCEENLELLDGAKSRAEKGFYIQIYNFGLCDKVRIMG